MTLTTRLFNNGWLAAAYWVFCFALTHASFSPTSAPAIPHIDKAIHFLMYLLLARFLAPQMGRYGKNVRSGAAFTLFVIALYASLDEWTQPYFDRTADIWDWTSDLAGALVGLYWGRKSLAR